MWLTMNNHKYFAYVIHHSWSEIIIIIPSTGIIRMLNMQTEYKIGIKHGCITMLKNNHIVKFNIKHAEINVSVTRGSSTLNMTCQNFLKIKFINTNAG